MKPQLEPLHGGWAAVGDGWTAYGQTRQDALQAYRLAKKGLVRRRRAANRGTRQRRLSRWS